MKQLINITITILVVISLFYLFFINVKIYTNVGSIKVSKSLISNNTIYTKHLKMAIHNDIESFHEFLKIEVKISEIYDHREVLLQLFDLKGDSLTIISIKNLTKNEKLKLATCLNFGVWDTDLKKYKGKSFEELFPEIKRALYK